jgi:hypothetical protein
MFQLPLPRLNVFKNPTGQLGGEKGDEARRSSVTPENIERVRDYFAVNGKNSIRRACVDLDLTFYNIWTILRKQLMWKPYCYKHVNRLTDQNRLDRQTSSHWVLAKDEGWEQQVIFSNEKWSSLHPGPDQQNE